MRTSNPMLNERTFTQSADWAEVQARRGSLGLAAPAAPDTMTVGGTAAKCLLLIGILVAAAAFTWSRFYSAGPQAVMPYLIGGVIGGLVLALVTAFARRAAPFTSPVYAVCEGLVLGAISAMMEARYKGIVISAVGLTFGVFTVMLVLYCFRAIRATPKFARGVIAATGGVLLVALANWLFGMFTGKQLALYEGGAIGIGFSAVVIFLAALNLILDFGVIEDGAARGAPKYLEWYAAFGLLVTLVWLYIEVLRLLAKLRGRR